ncbi:MAG: PA2779 family protein [Geminicoccaceae bacterium]|nr:PA2779 family protein [Geminicoccaceae bacterium]
MSMIIRGGRPIARLLIVALLAWSLPAAPAGAALVTTEQALASGSVEETRARLQGLLQRPDVRAELMALGVEPSEAEARLARLSDAEVAAVAGRLDDLPAGEGAIGAIIGAAVFIFVVLLITDLLGLTDFYPFVRR